MSEILKIEKVVAGGYGLARQDRQTVLVPWVLPGEEVEVKVERRGRGVKWGVPLRILTASPSRREPPCPHFAQCGGCSLQHAAYEEQVVIRRQILIESLHRIGKIDCPVEVVRSPEFGYRVRAQVKVRVRDGRASAGFFRMRSHEICPVERCRLLAEPADRIFAAVAARARAYSGLEAIDVLLQPDGALFLQLVFAGEVPAPALDEFLSVPACTGVWARSEAGLAETGAHSGADQARIRCGGIEYLVSPESFFQVNRHLWEEMIRAFRTVIGDGCRVAVDLYCGVGFLTLALAEKAERVIGVEQNPASIRMARAAAEAAGIRNAEFVLSDSEAFARGAGADPPDLLVLDPPRAGVSPEIIDRFSRTPRIVYFSCDAATFARDLHRFLQAGYRLSLVKAFDLFPQTAEIEALAVLDRD